MIQVEHLTKRYPGRTAVDDVSFSVGRGEVVGFLGPNGAGKSTTMRILTSYLPATAGRVTVAGHDVFADSLKSATCRKMSRCTMTFASRNTSISARASKDCAAATAANASVKSWTCAA